MNTLPINRSGSAASSLRYAMAAFALLAVLVGCDRSEHAEVSAEVGARTGQPAEDEQPFGQVTVFDRFTLRANVSPTEFLSEAMAQQYGIEAGPERALLHLVILERQSGREAEPVLAEVSARYEDLIGHSAGIEMRAVEADGQVSYIGTLDTSGQHVFRFVIDAQPAGADQPLQINFEAQLPTLRSK